jgi:hypothetical protein
MRRVSHNPNTREPKKKFLVEDTRNLAFAGATFSPSMVFFFSWTFSRSPSCGDRPPSLVVFFSSFSRPLLVETDHLPWSSSCLSHVPLIFGDRPALAELTGFHIRVHVCSSSEKKSFAFLTWATRRTKKTWWQILYVARRYLNFSLSCGKRLVGKEILRRQILVVTCTTKTNRQDSNSRIVI